MLPRDLGRAGPGPSDRDPRVRDHYVETRCPRHGRTALVTGGGRRGGIGHATACRLAAYGASVVVHPFAPHDATQAWGADDVDTALDEVRGHLAAAGAVAAGVHADLADPEEPQRVVDTARELVGPLDVLVANQALSGTDGPLGGLGVELDQHWAVDARASILLAQAWANAHDDAHPGGALMMLTSGQARGPMPGEAEMFPFGRFGEPDDPARLIAWLCTDEAYWITGQVIDSEGGFVRHRRSAAPVDTVE